MNESLLTPSNITFAIGILGIIFTVYNSFRAPQINSEKLDAIFDLKLGGLEKQIVNLRDNHIHTLDGKIDSTNAEIGKINVEVAKLATIIEERIPAGGRLHKRVSD